MSAESVGSSVEWSDIFSDHELASGNWSIWQYAQHLFYANPADGVYYSTIGHEGANVTDESGFVRGSWLPLYADTQSPGSTGDATVNYAFPAYRDQADLVDGVDTVELLEVQCGAVVAPSAESHAVIDAGKARIFIGNTELGWNNGRMRFKIIFGEARDLSKSNVAGYFMRSDETSATADDGADAFTVSQPQRLQLKDGAGNMFETTFASSGQVLTGVMEVSDEPSGGRLYVFVNLKEFSSNGVNLGAIKEMEFTVGIRVFGYGEYVLANFYTGGQYYHATSAAILPKSTDTELIYAYNFTEGSDTSSARTLVVPALNPTVIDDEAPTASIGHLGGARAWEAQNGGSKSPYLGSTLSINVPVADSPFTEAATINLYRKIGSLWYRISTSTNVMPMSFDDTLDDEAILSDGSSYPVTALSFDALPASASGIVTGILCGCAWKGSNCYAHQNGKLYLSRTNYFDQVEWENVVLTNEAGSTDLGPPRTLTVADDTVSPVILLLPAENLYCLTAQECYVLVSGNTAFESSFPRKIDGARGALGTRSGCVFGDRVLVGSHDGLWAIKKSTDYGEQPDELTELTMPIRPTWSWLLGSSPASVVVRHHAGHIWCFNEDRYLHLTREGNWIPGKWERGVEVVDAVSNPARGLVIQTDDGGLGMVGDYSTDGGTDLDGENGQEVTWSYRTGKVLSANTVERVSGFYESGEAGTSGVRFELPGDVVTFEAVGARSFSAAWRRFKSESFDIQISGKGRDVVNKATLHLSPRATTRGKK